MDAAPVRHLILYGSLKRGLAGHVELSLAERLRFLRPVSFPGRLYDLGDYPGLRLALTGRVHGELYEILDPAVLPELDAFELCRPDQPEPYNPATGAGSLYRRELLDVGVAAIVYVLNTAAAAPPLGRLIRSGRWPPVARAAPRR